MERISYRSSESGRVVKLFCTVGLNEAKITKYVEGEFKFVQRVDIIKRKRNNTDKEEITYDKEKWYILLI
jgi:hypothetical protein